MPLEFAFLVLEEHPYGREMLQKLLQNSLVPKIIIQESSAVADEERDKFYERMAGQPRPPEIAALADEHSIPVEAVKNHNVEACRQMLEALDPQLTVLGGTRIIKDYILSIPPSGTVNAHPGLLPWLRGSASVGWALYKDLPVGATVHFIDPGIDTGDIILREELPVHSDDTYESLNYRVTCLAADLMARAVALFAAGKEIPRMTQDINVGETFRVIPDDLLAEGVARLREGRYSHYAAE
jgi:methionyl-tRNA formyltransferase